MNPEDLRFLLELGRSGRLGEAARTLGVDETTVSRRISRLEAQLGVRLFDRGRSGWRLSEAGRQLQPFAESIEATVAAAVDRVASEPGTLTGRVRLMTTDGFGAYLLIPGLGELRRRHPGLELEIYTATSRGSLTERDFDVAVTLERPSSRGAFVRRLCDYELRLYASADYLREHGTPASLDEVRTDHTLIWYLDAVLDVEPLRLLDEVLPRARAQIQTNNITGHVEAARAGVGIAPLPSYIGQRDPSLRPVLPERFRVERSYWLVVPKDLAALARVRATAQAVTDIVRADPHLRPA